MEKKVDIDNPDAPRAEHVPEDELRQEELGGRRQSVAHNIIQNPLKVRTPRHTEAFLVCYCC